MTEAPENGWKLGRRGVLGFAAVALVAGCAKVTRTRASASTPTKPAPTHTASPSVSPTPTHSATPTPAKTTTEPAPARGGAVPFTPGKAMLGSYLSLGGKSLTQSLALRRSQLGRDQRIVHKFYPWSGYAPASEPDVPADSILMVSWHGTGYADITGGKSDTGIVTMAKALAGMKRPILLRWGWEMNGNWFAWDGTHNGQNPAGYVTSWRRLHRIFAEQGASNVAWVWSPNWNSAPASSWNRMQHYYPGDDYVDWVGVSGYDFGGESPATLYGPVVQAYGARKPIMLSEVAAVEPDKAKWIGKLAAWAAATPSLGAVVWFDTDVQPGSPHNFRPDTDAAALAAYRKMATSKRFSG